MPRRLLPSLLLPFVIALALLLAGGWEWRTAARAADAESDRMRTALTLSANAAAHGLDDELAGVARAFALTGPADDTDAIARRLAEWRRTAAHPRFVTAVYVVAGLHSDAPQWFRIREDGPAESPMPVPRALQALLPNDFRVSWPMLRLRPLGRGDLLVMKKPAAPGLLVVAVDPRVVIPDLALRHFGNGKDLLCRVSLGRRGDRTMIWSSSPAVADEVVVDAGTLDGVAMWRFGAAYRGGSIDELVAATRRRSLITGAAILALLGIAVAYALLESRRAQEAAWQQAAFVTGITHELNTPVAAIGATAANLADGIITDPAQVRRYGTAIGAEASRLAAMIANVLGSMRDDASTPRKEALDASDVVDEAMADLRTLLDQRGFTLTHAREPAPLRADHEQLRRAVRNLLDNAVKYSGIAREVHVVTAARGGEVVISVEDQGIGVEAGELARLGQPFFRGARARREPAGGAGLGLALVQRVARAHGGWLEIERREEGMTFRLVLPS
jgi:two-component system sensor histidine kinase SenX3